MQNQPQPQPSKYTYTVVELNDNPEETVIEKHGPIGTLTLSRIPQLMEQHRNEAAGEENKIAQAKANMEKEEREHRDVAQYLARMPVASLHAIIRWGYNAALLDGAKARLQLIDQQMQQLRDEEAEIRRQTGISPKPTEEAPEAPIPSPKKKHGKSR